MFQTTRPRFPAVLTCLFHKQPRSSPAPVKLLNHAAKRQNSVLVRPQTLQRVKGKIPFLWFAYDCSFSSFSNQICFAQFMNNDTKLVHELTSNGFGYMQGSRPTSPHRQLQASPSRFLDWPLRPRQPLEHVTL